MMSERLEHSDPRADCEAMAPRRTWLQRLFPARALIIEDDERPGFAPGYMTIETVMVLDWKDRLRMLVSGKLHVTTKTFTSVHVERAKSESVIYVLPPNTRLPEALPPPPRELSRSVQRRLAHQRGEPVPTFDGEECEETPHD